MPRNHWLLLGSLILALGACKDNTARYPVDAVDQTESIDAPFLGARVELVRDAWGIPHIYGDTLADVAFAQGYIMARDRMVQMDLARHLADGTLARLFGTVLPSIIDNDIAMRAQRLRPNADAVLAQLRASSDPADQELVDVVTRFTAGVNAYITALKAGRFSLTSEVALFYDPQQLAAWSESDCLLLGELQAFNLAYNATTEIALSRVEAAALQTFPSGDPRNGLTADLSLLAPVDPTYTISGWPGLTTLQPAQARGPAAGQRPGLPSTMAPGQRSSWLALLESAQATLRGIGNDQTSDIDRGSNNWVIGPALSATGNALVANDTHLDLGNPATFYLVHLTVRGGTRPGSMMGVQFPGIPGIILGMNDHIAWGGTVSFVDAADVYAETIVPCTSGGGASCVLFRGAEVPLVPRTERIEIGLAGNVQTTMNVTLYDVPHHGPIIPRLNTDHTVAPLGSMELSVRYTGHVPAQQLRAVINLDRAQDVDEGLAALQRDFKYGGQNWVIGDDQKNIAWTQTARIPRRAPGYAPWKVLPGDGTAEWGGDLEQRYVPQALNPAAGFIATANNDPVGASGDNDPFFNEPVVSGAPLYAGFAYDAGTRVGRINKRIRAITDAGRKLTADDMQSIQADVITEWGELMAPTLRQAARALAEEIATPGSDPELSSIAAAASPTVKALALPVADRLDAWTFDTPSGIDPDTGQRLTSPAGTVGDSQAAAVFAAWFQQFGNEALGDEFQRMGTRTAASVYLYRLLVRMSAAPATLATGVSTDTGDALLFDNIDTPAVESKQQIAAQALVVALDYLAQRMGSDLATWRWGLLHTLTLTFPALNSLSIPRPDETMFVGGFPRPGGIGTVDQAPYPSIPLGTYSVSFGPAIRFVCELTPSGPRARNVLPGGETFDSGSPHYRDQMERWRRNQTFDLAFVESDVVTSAEQELGQRGNGRIHFQPTR